MKHYLSPVLATIICVSSVQASMKIDSIKEVLQIMEQTVMSLKSCKDKGSTKIAIDQLIKLRGEAEKIAKKLDQMAEPPPEEFPALISLGNSFASINKQIEAETERIKKDKLYTPELAAALGYPTEEAEPEADKKEATPAANDADDPAPSAK